MKTTELRRGNLINHTFDEYDDDGDKTEKTKVFVINEIRESNVCFAGNVYPTGLTDINEIDPLPITEERLVELGFKTISEWGDCNLNYWNKENDSSVDVELVLTDTKIEKIFYYRILGSMEIRKRIVYVHKLQNLHYELKGEELIFNSLQ